MKNFTQGIFKKIFVASAFAGCMLSVTYAQQKKLTFTGYNHDGIADPVLNAIPDTLTDIAIDGGGGSVFFTTGYSNGATPYAGGLPVNGVVLSPTGHYYQIRPSDSLNILEVDFSGIDTATLTLSATDQISYDTLYLLAAAGFGVTYADVYVNFTNGTSTNYGYNVPDWYCAGCTTYAINNLTPVNRTTGYTSLDSQMAIYEQPLLLADTDKVKIVKSITFDVPEEVPGHVNVFAVTGISASILPVSLVSFGASIKNGQALLQWKTSQESNNRQYIVERAPAATPDMYEKIGTVNAIYSSGGSSYAFANSPGIAGTYLYRLSQQDADGNTKILGIRSITFNSNVHWLVQDLGSRWKLVTSSAYRYRLLDINGKIIQESSGSGTTSISKPGARGIYLLQVWQGGQSGTQKLIH